MNALCGPQYTKKLSDMYQDLIVSEDASRVRMMPRAAFARRAMLTQNHSMFLTGICPALRASPARRHCSFAAVRVHGVGAEDVVLAGNEHVRVNRSTSEHECEHGALQCLLQGPCSNQDGGCGVPHCHVCTCNYLFLSSIHVSSCNGFWAKDLQRSKFSFLKRSRSLFPVELCKRWSCSPSTSMPRSVSGTLLQSPYNVFSCMQ